MNITKKLDNKSTQLFNRW